MPFSDHQLELDGCRTHYRRGGRSSSDAAPLVFLHGASGAPVVLPFMERLAERFDVIVPDHPGYGQSEEPDWLENIHDVAYFYLDFLAALKLERAVIVGSSMGGWMAMEMAVRNTSRIGSLVLVTPPGTAPKRAPPAPPQKAPSRPTSFSSRRRTPFGVCSRISASPRSGSPCR